MKLYIVGAGDVGGFVAYHAFQMGEYKINGFFDDNAALWGQRRFGFDVIGGVNKLIEIGENVAVVIAISDPKIKEIIYKKLIKRSNFVFPNLIHPTAWIGQKVILGNGNIVYPGVSINFETKIKNFVIINMNAVIGHNGDFQDFTTISPGVNCGGFTSVGKKSFLGINSTTLQSIAIGKECTVGAGAVITRDVPDGVTIVGNPGRIIKVK